MHDRPIQQTKKDMHQARARSNLNLKLLRNYLYSEQCSIHPDLN